MQIVDYYGLKISLNNYLDATFPDIIRVYDENFANPSVFNDGARWITPIYGNCVSDEVIKRLEFFVYVFSKSDPEGLELAKIVTRVLKAFYDETQNDGRKRIPFYEVDNGALVQISSIIASDTSVEGIFRLEDSTIAQAVRVELSWC